MSSRGSSGSYVFEQCLKHQPAHAAFLIDQLSCPSSESRLRDAVDTPSESEGPSANTPAATPFSGVSGVSDTSAGGTNTRAYVPFPSVESSGRGNYVPFGESAGTPASGGAPRILSYSPGSSSSLGMTPLSEAAVEDAAKVAMGGKNKENFNARATIRPSPLSRRYDSEVAAAPAAESVELVAALAAAEAAAAAAKADAAAARAEAESAKADVAAMKLSLEQAAATHAKELSAAVKAVEDAAASRAIRAEQQTQAQAAVVESTVALAEAKESAASAHATAAEAAAAEAASDASKAHAAKEALVAAYEAEAAAEKEKRIEHLCSVIARRMLRKDLSRGWFAWYEQWQEEARTLRLLKTAAERLRRPALSAALSDWKADAAQAGAAAKAQAAAEAQAAALAAAIKQAAIEKEEAVGTAIEEATLAAAAAAEAEEAKSAQEREQRVQHLTGVILKRMLRKDLSRGWVAWCEQYEERTLTLRLLRSAAQRLRKPTVSAAFAGWKTDAWRAGWKATASVAKTVAVARAVAAAEADARVATDDAVGAAVVDALASAEKAANVAMEQAVAVAKADAEAATKNALWTLTTAAAATTVEDLEAARKEAAQATAALQESVDAAHDAKAAHEVAFSKVTEELTAARAAAVAARAEVVAAKAEVASARRVAEEARAAELAATANAAHEADLRKQATDRALAAEEKAAKAAVSMAKEASVGETSPGRTMVTGYGEGSLLGFPGSPPPCKHVPPPADSNKQTDRVQGENSLPNPVPKMAAAANSLLMCGTSRVRK